MSWIIIDKETRRPVVEVFDQESLNHLGDKYEALSPQQWLAELQNRIDEGEEH